MTEIPADAGESITHGNQAPPDRYTVIRVSSLPGWPDCNRRGAARLFKRIIENMGFQLRTTPRGIGASVGTAVHKSASVILDEKARSGELPPNSVGCDAAADTLDEEVRQGVMFDGDRGATRTHNEATRQVVMMSSTYHRVIAPDVFPILVEERLEAEVEPGLILSGQPDLVAREPGQIRDLKTGTRLSNYFSQAGGYSLLARTPRPGHPEGIEITQASIDFIKRERPDKVPSEPIIKPVPIEAAETAAANIIRNMAQSLKVFMEGDPERRIQPGDPWAFESNPQSVLCSARFCPAHSTEFCKDHMDK